MAGTIVASTLSDGTNSTSTTNVINGAKAWVNFNGTGTVAIRASYNVSSITDLGAGAYTINFTNAFTDTNYAVVSAADSLTGNAAYSRTLDGSVARTTTAVSVQTVTAGGVAVDSAICQFAVFR